ncbi:hypothetical protein A5866_000037 [Enterococcus sp. 12C11_DIV0727]|uniref:Resolvase/invertase-type recombinase catalytic domain-containing protein n=1 Tax=Candidatus Enterococcus lemimoniae TaxID=1834167 RepID=A0ABZ2T278_9ENTE|nr:hypothetical protein A5866_003431 [Enterococcus sp. 12C11_DIV0727]
MSGKNMNRPELQKMLNYVRKDDTIYFESLGGLGRDYDEIKETLVSLKSKGVKVQFLDAPFLNFNTGNELIDKAMFDIFLSLLSYIAQNEKEKIRLRQKCKRKRNIQRTKNIIHTGFSKYSKASNLF